LAITRRRRRHYQTTDSVTTSPPPWKSDTEQNVDDLFIERTIAWECSGEKTQATSTNSFLLRLSAHVRKIYGTRQTREGSFSKMPWSMPSSSPLPTCTIIQNSQKAEQHDSSTGTEYGQRLEFSLYQTPKRRRDLAPTLHNAM